MLGAIGRQSVGSFSYEKRLKNGRSVECEVRVFPLERQYLHKRIAEEHAQLEQLAKRQENRQAAAMLREESSQKSYANRLLNEGL